MRRRNRFGAIPVVANPFLRVARGGGPEAGVSLRAPGDAIPGLNANEEPLCLRCNGMPLDVTANGSDIYQAGSGDPKPGSRSIAQLRCRWVWFRSRARGGPQSPSRRAAAPQ